MPKHSQSEAATPEAAPLASALATVSSAPTTGGVAVTPPPAAAVGARVVKLPPADARIPQPPAGFVATKGTEYLGLTPRKAELASIGDAVDEIASCPDYAQLFAVTGLTQSHLSQVLDGADQWSTMRNASAQWDAFCRVQEGLAWTAVHQVMALVKPAFEIATTANATFATKYPGIRGLLGAAKAVAQRSASTRRANKDAVASGKEPVHGAVGKRRQKAAAKAAYEASTATPSPAPAPAPSAVLPAPSVEPPVEPPPSPTPTPAAGSASVPTRS